MEKTWRLTREEYLKERREILARHESVNEWAKLSMDSTMSDRERMTRIMMDNDPDIPMNSYICQLYMCQYHPMSQEFLEDAIYVNSGLCLLGYWDEEILNWVADLYQRYPKITNTDINVYEEVLNAVEKGKFKESIPKYHQFLVDKIGSSSNSKIALQDRLDWWALPTALYSKDFLKRYQFKQISKMI